MTGVTGLELPADAGLRVILTASFSCSRFFLRAAEADFGRLRNSGALKPAVDAAPRLLPSFWAARLAYGSHPAGVAERYLPDLREYLFSFLYNRSDADMASRGVH